MNLEFFCGTIFLFFSSLMIFDSRQTLSIIQKYKWGGFQISIALYVSCCKKNCRRGMIFLDVWLNGLYIHGIYNAICLLKDYNEFCIILEGKNHNYVKYVLWF